MENEQIISIDEFRKFAGKDVEQFSDTQVKELINQLDLIAQLFVKQQRSEFEETTTSV